MKKVVVATVLALAMMLSMVGSAAAITGGQPDGNGHPYGALILVPGYGFCSGTLIDEDLVLTAGHCTDFFDGIDWDGLPWEEWHVEDPGVWVTFDPEASVDLYWWTITGGTWYKADGWATHPDYVASYWPFTADYGLVFLDEDVVSVTPAELPEAGLLDELIGATGQTQERFYDVGYGQNGVFVGGGYPIPNFDFVRKVSEQRYSPSKGSVGTLDPAWLILNNVPSEQHGSGCGGDSGSGIFMSPEGVYGDTVVAVHTGGYRLGNTGQICGRITSLNHRVDIPEVLNWIAGYMD